MMSPSGTQMSEMVSVVIPVYNGVRFLRQALASIHAQQYSNLEIIVADDGSSDRAEQLAGQYPKVTWLYQEHRGSAAARNLGIRHSRGTFLAFLDADDVWAENKLSLQVSVLRRSPEIHLVAGHVEEFYEPPAAPNPMRSNQGIGQRAYTIGALLATRTDFLRVGLLDETLQFGEFLDWHSRAMALGLRERVLDCVVLRRRVHGGNATAHAGREAGDYLRAIQAHFHRKRRAAADGNQPFLD